MGRLGGAGEEEEMHLLWELWGLEVGGGGQLLLGRGGVKEKGQEREEAEVRDSVWPPVSKAARGVSRSCVPVV